jgi:hypothetical protein
MKISLKKSLTVLMIGSMLIGNAMAAEIVFAPVTFVVNLTGHHTEYFNGTAVQLKSLKQAPSFYDSLLDLIIFPFVILDEKSNELSVSAQELEALSYSSEEISQYQSDLGRISELASSAEFSSVEEIKAAVSLLELGIVAKEQMRIK